MNLKIIKCCGKKFYKVLDVITIANLHNMWYNIIINGKKFNLRSDYHAETKRNGYWWGSDNCLGTGFQTGVC